VSPAPVAPAPTSVARTRTRSRQASYLLASFLLLGTSLALGMLVGSRGLTPWSVLELLRGSATAETRAILVELRLPRTVVAALAGGSLAVAGAVMQAHLRNPLADPGLLGVSAGAAVAVVLAIALLGVSTPDGYRWFAFAGAAAGAVLVTAFGLLGSSRRDSSPATLVLAGSAVTAFLSAVTGLVLLLDAATLDAFRFWTVGSLGAVRGIDQLAPVLPFLVAGLLLALAQSGTLDALVLGDDVARGLGRRLGPARLSGLAAVTLLVGSAVSIAGSIGFVGLVVPHAVRRLTGPGHTWLLPQCAVLGAALVVVADVAGRVLVHPDELPVGIVLGVVGAPLFLAILVRTARGR